MWCDRVRVSVFGVLLAASAAPLAAAGPSREAPVSPAPAMVGKIEIPRLGIDAPVREGSEDETLRVAVGHIEGTARLGANGNAGLAAHRNTFFRGLRGVKVGDVVVVTTADGVFTYRVNGLSVVEPTQVSVLAPTPKPTLTLVTCYPFDWVGEAPQRLIVKAERVDQPPAIAEHAGPAERPGP